MKTILGVSLLAGLIGWAGLEEARSIASGKTADPLYWRDDEHAVIRAASYCPERQVLTLEFRQGYAYRYRGVPPECFAAFKATRAKGAFYNDHIRGRFEMERVLDRILTRPTSIEGPGAPPHARPMIALGDLTD